MNQLLAALLAQRLAALPFASSAAGARVAGLARLHTSTINDGESTRTVKVPVPAEWSADECTRDSRYLTPDANTPGIWFFEDYGTAEERIDKSNLYQYVSSLRLLAWINPAWLSYQLSEAALFQAVAGALRLHQRQTAGAYRNLLLTATVLPAEASLFSRYTYASETPLLLPPYQLLGLEIRARFTLAGPCPPAALPGLLAVRNPCLLPPPAPLVPVGPVLSGLEVTAPREQIGPTLSQLNVTAP